jgi:AraC-like DNA-binding protein
MVPPAEPNDTPDVIVSRSFLAALTTAGVTAAQHEAALRAANARHGMFWTEDLGPHALQAYARALDEFHGPGHLGLKVARAMPDGANGVLEYLLLTAPCLRASQLIHARFGLLTADYLRFELRESDGHSSVALVPPEGLVLAPLMEEYRVGRTLLGMRRALKQPQFTPSDVYFTVLRPASLLGLQEFFGRDVRFHFAQPRAGLSVATNVLDQPLPTSDPALHRILLDHAQALMQKAPVPTNVAARVRQALVAQLHVGRPSINAVGRRLGMSERTLRRRLAEENTSFGDLLDQVRSSLARVLSRAADQTEKGVAHKLGFESTSALRRAQKRWAARMPPPLEEAL